MTRVGERLLFERNIIDAISDKPMWMPEIAKTSGTTLIKTRNIVARLFDEGWIDITRSGFVSYHAEAYQYKTPSPEDMFSAFGGPGPDGVVNIPTKLYSAHSRDLGLAVLLYVALLPHVCEVYVETDAPFRPMGVLPDTYTDSSLRRLLKAEYPLLKIGAAKTQKAKTALIESGLLLLRPRSGTSYGLAIVGQNGPDTSKESETVNVLKTVDQRLSAQQGSKQGHITAKPLCTENV